MLKIFFRLFISYSLFVAVCAAAMSLQSWHILGHSINISLLVFIFLATTCAYNSYWIASKYYFSSVGWNNFRHFLLRQKGHFIIVLASVVGMAFLLMRLHLVLYNIAITFSLLVLYSLPVLLHNKRNFLRHIDVFKTVLLAFTWTHITVLIPLQKSILVMSGNEWYLFFCRFFFIFILCIIFDKKDVENDKRLGRQSLATFTGDKGLYILVLISFLLYFLSVYMLGRSYGPVLSFALYVTGIATAVIYLLSWKKRSYLFYYFIVDGMMILSALLTSLASI